MKEIGYDEDIFAERARDEWKLRLKVTIGDDAIEHLDSAVMSPFSSWAFRGNLMLEASRRLSKELQFF